MQKWILLKMRVRKWIERNSALLFLLFIVSIIFLLPIVMQIIARYDDDDRDIVGKIEVTDGDTIKIAGKSIRLWGIDAPERYQQCPLANGKTFYPGREAKKWLKEHAHGKQGYCKFIDGSSHGRDHGVCYLEGDDNLSLNKTIVGQGYAFDYGRYSDSKYEDTEKEARNSMHGLWRFGSAVWDSSPYFSDSTCTYPDTYRRYLRYK